MRSDNTGRYKKMIGILYLRKIRDVQFKKMQDVNVTTYGNIQLALYSQSARKERTPSSAERIAGNSKYFPRYISLLDIVGADPTVKFER